MQEFALLIPGEEVFFFYNTKIDVMNVPREQQKMHPVSFPFRRPGS